VRRGARRRRFGGAPRSERLADLLQRFGVELGRAADAAHAEGEQCARICCEVACLGEANRAGKAAGRRERQAGGPNGRRRQNERRRPLSLEDAPELLDRLVEGMTAVIELHPRPDGESRGERRADDLAEAFQRATLGDEDVHASESEPLGMGEVLFEGENRVARWVARADDASDRHGVPCASRGFDRDLDGQRRERSRAERMPGSRQRVRGRALGRGEDDVAAAAQGCLVGGGDAFPVLAQQRRHIVGTLCDAVCDQPVRHTRTEEEGTRLRQGGGIHPREEPYSRRGGGRKKGSVRGGGGRDASGRCTCPLCRWCATESFM
jgi:hypothetical protein